MLQSEKFDKFCTYILTWVPELKECKPEHIHKWQTCYAYYKRKNLGYPDPLVQHAVRRKECVEMYDKAKEGKEITRYPTLPDHYPSKIVHGGKRRKENFLEARKKKRDYKNDKTEEEVEPIFKKTKKTLNKEVCQNENKVLKVSDWFNFL